MFSSKHWNNYHYNTPFIEYLSDENMYNSDISLYLQLIFVYAAAAKLLQSCPTLCDPMDGSPPGSPVPGILQGRTLEWVAMFFFNAWKWKVKVNLLSRVWLVATPWTAAYQAPLSMGFSRQEYWSGGAIGFTIFHVSPSLGGCWLFSVAATSVIY